MRLIDADALQNEYKQRHEGKRLLLIDVAPTIELKKGRWITKSTNGEMFDSCSVCGYVEWDVPRNYCPNCGARMEE